MKKIIYFLVIVISLVWLFSAQKDNLAKRLIEKGIAKATGLRCEMQDLRLGIWKTEIEINSLRLFSPREYKETLFLDAPHIFMDYDFAQLLKKKIFIENMQIELKEIILVRDAKGKLNAFNFLSTGSAKSLSASLPLEIKNLDLKIGRLIYKDYAKDKDNPQIEEFKLNLAAHYSDIHDLNTLVKKIISEVLLTKAVEGLNSSIKGIFSQRTSE